MFHKKLCPILVLMLVFPVMADIQISTTINDLHAKGSSEWAGSVIVRVDDADFRDVSPAEPYYMRINLREDAVLAHTLVDLNSGDPRTSQPIYLAMQAIGSPGADMTLLAPSDTVSIMRWVAGEAFIWLRVQHSSDSWLEVDGQVIGPSTFFNVQWVFGLSARHIFESLENEDPNHLNLPFNTRNLTTSGNTSDAVSTLMCMDLRHSGLGENGRLAITYSNFDHTAQISPGVYGGGNPVGVIFPTTYPIGRSGETPCDLVASSHFGSAIQDGDLIFFDGMLEFGGNCVGPRLGPINVIREGSFLTLETDAANQIGFEAGYAYFPDQIIGGVEVVDPESAFVIDGRTLFSRITLFWNDDDQSLINVPVAIRLAMIETAGAMPPALDWNWHLSWKEVRDIDNPPFDGPDQHAFCGASLIDAQSGTHQTAINVPTLGQWALIVFCSLLATSAMWLRRRRFA